MWINGSNSDNKRNAATTRQHTKKQQKKLYKKKKQQRINNEQTIKTWITRIGVSGGGCSENKTEEKRKKMETHEKSYFCWILNFGIKAMKSYCFHTQMRHGIHSIYRIRCILCHCNVAFCECVICDGSRDRGKCTGRGGRERMLSDMLMCTLLLMSDMREIERVWRGHAPAPFKRTTAGRWTKKLH